MRTRRLRPLDRVIGQFDHALRTVSGHVGKTSRPSPATGPDKQTLSPREQIEAGRLMRINHCGEVCAQALYNGQALTAHNERTAASLQHAAAEETDHLSWCEGRIRELDGHVSHLNPIWYGASFSLGALTGLLGDRINLFGSLPQPRNRSKNISRIYLDRLPPADTRSRAILRQMSEDEAKHGRTALDLGGTRFPPAVKHIMRGISRAMTGSTYWI
ncbi:MAG: 2-polyprenyl-3-methyl-6-methoxy-1,4-benzoquinone monooxygenase [Gammaproteobacteria bacterium]|nr:2-polyprenyl-3-methyl-6-methoxy-1,4-benzoquinone monooxygenase [Gammaproteobacteria bacterium]